MASHLFISDTASIYCVASIALSDCSGPGVSYPLFFNHQDVPFRHSELWLSLSVLSDFRIKPSLNKSENKGFGGNFNHCRQQSPKDKPCIPNQPFPSVLLYMEGRENSGVPHCKILNSVLLTKFSLGY